MVGTDLSRTRVNIVTEACYLLRASRYVPRPYGVGATLRIGRKGKAAVLCTGPSFLIGRRRFCPSAFASPLQRTPNDPSSHILVWYKKRKPPETYNALQAVTRTARGTDSRQRPKDQVVKAIRPANFQEDNIGSYPRRHLYIGND